MYANAGTRQPELSSNSCNVLCLITSTMVNMASFNFLPYNVNQSQPGGLGVRSIVPDRPGGNIPHTRGDDIPIPTEQWTLDIHYTLSKWLRSPQQSPNYAMHLRRGHLGAHFRELLVTILLYYDRVRGRRESAGVAWRARRSFGCSAAALIRNKFRRPNGGLVNFIGTIGQRRQRALHS